MAEVEQDWARLGRMVAAERARRDLTVRALAELAGIGTRTLQDIEAGSRSTYRPVTLARLEDALGWEPGSASSVLAGGEARRTRDPLLERLAALWPRLTPRQRRALIVVAEEMVD